MSFLSVGTNRGPLLERVLSLSQPYLLIDDGSLIDQLVFPKRRKEKSAFPKVTRFDPDKHHFNPVREISYFRQREFVSTIDGITKRGDGTLTKDTGLTFILRNLQLEPRYLRDLIPEPDGRSSTGHVWAYDKIDEILLSPVLKEVFSKARDFPIEGILLARLDPAKLGEYDCRILGNFLIAQHPGLVIVTDFPLYAGKHHISLIHQDRLIAGINTFDELPDLKHHLVQIGEKVGSRCTIEDAQILAKYHCKNLPGTDGYGTFIGDCIK